MFLKKNRRKNGTTNKEYFTYTLVESVRGVKYYEHKYIISVGRLDDFSENEIKMLEKFLVDYISGGKEIDNNGLFQISEKVKKKYDEVINKYYKKQQLDKGNDKKQKEIEEKRKSGEYITINRKHNQTENSRSIGPENLCLEMYNELDLDNILSQNNFTKRQIEVAKILIIGRLIEPGSELSTLDWAQNRSGIGELAGVDYTKLSKKLLYSTVNKIKKYKDEIEENLEKIETELYGAEDKIILYDITNTYFEGEYRASKLAKYNKNSKEKRTDCPVVGLGFIINKDGYPKASKIFEGNYSEPLTLEGMILQLEEMGGYGKRLINKKPVIVMDAGLGTEDNIKYLKKHGYNYVVVSRSKKTEGEQINEYEKVKEMKTEMGELENMIEIRRNQSKDEIYLECKSYKKNLKEESMAKRLEDLLEKELINIENMIVKGRLKDSKKIFKKIGKIEGKYAKIAQYYDIEIQEIEGNNNSKQYSIKWKQNNEKQKKYKEKREKYILRSNLVNAEDGEIWDIYNTIRRIEESFKIMKTDLRIRPIYHKTDENIIGHITITIIAYHIVNIALNRLKEKGENIRWDTLIKKFVTQKVGTIKMETIEGKIKEDRIVDNPNEEQRKYYNMIGIKKMKGFGRRILR